MKSLSLLLLFISFGFGGCVKEAPELESYFLVQETAELSFYQESPEHLEAILVTWLDSARRVEHVSNSFDPSEDMWLVCMRLYAVKLYLGENDDAELYLQMAIKEYAELLPSIVDDTILQKCLLDWVSYEEGLRPSPSWLLQVWSKEKLKGS